MRSLTLLLFLFGWASCTSLDAALPIYMRGMHWNKVQEHLKEDLRLSEDVIPTNYAIDLSVNVRGHEGAEKSEFNGTITIHLDIFKPVDKIELHSKGLIIEKAEMVESLAMSIPLGVTRISSNPDRETITLHLNRTIQTEEKFMLQISYHGSATMDEYGLYENWDPKFNKTFFVTNMLSDGYSATQRKQLQDEIKSNKPMDSNGPIVLASRNFPTGARTWFPCFDEPTKKATFDLQVNHPSGLNAYSNAETTRTEGPSNGRTLSVFKKTESLATNQIALSVNHLSVQPLDVKGFGKVRFLTSKSAQDYFATRPHENKDGVDVNDIPGVLKRTLELLNEFDYGMNSKGKLDIILLEATSTNSIQPGLVTIGRSNLLSGHKQTHDLRDLIQLPTMTHASVRTSNEMWLNRMFSYVFNNITYPRVKSFKETFEVIPYDMLHSSLHERPLQERTVHAFSTKQYLSSTNTIRSLKASQILKFINRFCPLSKKAVQDYLMDQNIILFDVDYLVTVLSNSCKDSAEGREFLSDFIKQSGKPFLIVKRTESGVVIKQTRYHSTYFDSKLRDNKTRFTIPIPYTIDGNSGFKVFHKNETSINISVSDTELFLIDNVYDHLYLVYYEDSITPRRNVTEEERKIMVTAIWRSMISAINIGFVKYDTIHAQLKAYFESGIFDELDFNKVHWNAQKLLDERPSLAYQNDAFYDRPYECANGLQTDWNDLFNNETIYWSNWLSYDNLANFMPCMTQWKKSSLYLRFLEENLLGESTIIRPDQMSKLARRTTDHQWRELHRFFFRNAGNFTDHRFNLLADVVLNKHSLFELHYNDYPRANIQEDYLKELRDFVIRNPKLAASMSTEIETRMELEFVRNELRNWHNMTSRSMEMKSFFYLNLTSRRN